MSREGWLVLVLLCSAASGCEEEPEDPEVVATWVDGGSCGGLYVETCDEVPSPGESSGTISGRFGSESLVFDILTAQVSDCGPPMWTRMYSLISEGSETNATSFEAEFRLDEDGSYDPLLYDFDLTYYDSTTGEAASYGVYDRSGEDLVMTIVKVEIEEIGTWSMKGSFEGVLSGSLGHEGEDIWIDGEFDVATESGVAACD